MIKAVLFDLRDTLLDVKQAYKSSGDFLLQFVNQHGVIINLEKLQNDLSEIRKTEIENNDWKSTYNWDAIFLPALLKRYKINLSVNQLTKFLDEYAKVFAEQARLYPDAAKILKYLRKNDIKTGVIIDGTKKRENMILTKTGLGKLIDIATISEEVGQSKFSDLPLKDALKKLGTSPANVLVIGDRIDKDIIHANRAGCMTAKLERPSGRYTDINALSDEEKPDFIIHSLELDVVLPLLD